MKTESPARQGGSPGRRLIAALLELHAGGGSRVVRVESGPHKKQFVIRRGALSFAESNAPDEHLAQVLVRMKLLQRSDLSQVASLMKEGQGADAAVMACARLPLERVTEGAREQATGILASLLAWEKGELRQYHADAAPKRLFDLELPLPELVMLGVRRAVAQKILPSAFRQLTGVLAPAAQVPAGLMSLPMSAPEARAISSIQAPCAPAEAELLLAGLGEEPRELILRLLLLGFLSCTEPCAPPEARAEEEASDELSLALRRLEEADLYQVLEVPADADPERIKLAYHDLALRYHPDRYQSGGHSAEDRGKAERIFSCVTGAYETLSDPASRAQYDEERLKKGAMDAARRARAGADPEKEKMAEAVYASARAALAGGEFERAAERLKECVFLIPDNARYRYNLGLAQGEIPRLRKEAEQNLLKALELDRTLLNARIALGRLYLKVKLPRRAEVQLREALALDPDHPEAAKLRAAIAEADADRR